MADEDEEEQQRLQLEKFQREQAEKARLASRGQPNTIPPEQSLEQPVRAVDMAQRGLPVPPGGLEPGQAFSTNPQGAAGIQGTPIQPREEAFWAANPNGAVVDPRTGSLIGLGDANVTSVNAGLGPPAIPWNQQERINTGLGPAAVSMGQQFQTRQPQTINDYINPKIEAQIGNLERKHSTILRSLDSFSPISAGRGQKSPRALELEKLGKVEGALSGLRLERRQQAEMSFKTQKENQKLERETGHLNTGSEIAKWINTLPKDPAARQQAWQQELAKPERGHWLEAVLENDGVNEYVKGALKTHQTVAEQAAALQAAVPGKEVAITGGEGDRARLRVTDPNAVPNAAATRYNRIQGDILYHQETAAAQKEKDKGKKPYEGIAVLHGLEKEMAGLEKRYPGLKAATPEATATPSATPAKNIDDAVRPIISLAQKALQDPNASEADKAQARKILGVK